MGRPTELLGSQSGLAQRAGCGGVDILAEDGESLPKGVCLEGQNDLYPSLLGHGTDQVQIPAQPVFLKDIDGSVQLGECILIYCHE